MNNPENLKEEDSFFRFLRAFVITIVIGVVIIKNI